jgi:hypothetical protein
MDLKDFVASSLTQIVEGVKMAQQATGASGAWINPATRFSKSDETVNVAPGISAYVHDVEFDVAVTVSDKQGADAGAKLEIFGAKIGGGGNVAYENQAVSRVAFSVPVVWPPSTREDLEKQIAEQVRKNTDQLIRGLGPSPT